MATIPHLQALRDSYLIQNGSALSVPLLPVPPAARSLCESHAMEIADAFERALHAPAAPNVAAAYGQFTQETRSQWELLAGAGYVMEPWLAAGQPYRDSREMRQDVQSRHLFFFLTLAGFGEVDCQLDHSQNPLLRPAGVVQSGIPLSFNDLFRAVHDIFGHAQEGHSFGPIGEENAWRCHSSMFSANARRAMTTETRGQNSWFNYGPHLRGADGAIPRRGSANYVAPKDRPYPPQKTFLLPDCYVFDALP
jgi:hypothetical protein